MSSQKQQGFIRILGMIAILAAAVALPIAVYLVRSNAETRSSASVSPAETACTGLDCTPTPVPAEAGAQPPCFIYDQQVVGFGIGDADGLGAVTAKDTFLVQQIVAGLAQPVDTNAILRADVDNDGQITARDSLVMQRYIAGLILTFEACNTISMSPSPLTTSSSSATPMMTPISSAKP